MWSFAAEFFGDMKRQLMSLGRDRYSLPRTYRRVEAAKAKARSELKNFGWDTLGYAESFDLPPLKDNILRVDGNSLSVEDFRREYERPRVPIILTGLADNWMAKEKWTLERLSKKYRNQNFKCGEDDKGNSVRMKMKYYHDYMLNNRDDSPLYIFDSSFAERRKTKKLSEDYEVPKFFADDLFHYADDKKRPPHRWFVMGPARSGTAIHIDPLGTSAWNTLLTGHKRWVLIPPTAPRELVKPMAHEKGKHPDEGVTWFQTVYRRVKCGGWPKEFAPIECRQAPGETMFVPAGWWHVVINEDFTVAVTHNYCSVENLHLVWPKTVKGRPKLSKHWFKILSEKRPEVLGIIKACDETPVFDMNESSSDSSSSSSSSSDSSSEESDYEHVSSAGETRRKRRYDDRESSCPEKMRNGHLGGHSVA